MVAVTALAPAKLNLYLHILGRQPDGYHRVESLVAFADMGDRVNITQAADLTLLCDGPFAEAAGGGEANLVMRAARLLQQKTGCTRGATIRLTKSLPVGAGLGGGSADAAAVLNLLNQLWDLDLPLETLQRWAPELGADVAMCLVSRLLVATGIGEKLTPLSQLLPPLFAVLAHPRTPLLTKDVYGALKTTTIADAAENAVDMPQWASADRFMEWLQLQRNDLEAPAKQVSPEVAHVLQALARVQPASRLVRMSGSGACCYALYTTAQDAQQAANQLRKAHPVWWVAETSLSASAAV